MGTEEERPLDACIPTLYLPSRSFLFLSFISSKGRLLTKKISPLGSYQVDPTVEPVDLLSQPPYVYRLASWWGRLSYGFAPQVHPVF